jgi:hypothetical protein
MPESDRDTIRIPWLRARAATTRAATYAVAKSIPVRRIASTAPGAGHELRGCPAAGKITPEFYVHKASVAPEPPRDVRRLH